MGEWLPSFNERLHHFLANCGILATRVSMCSSQGCPGVNTFCANIPPSTLRTLPQLRQTIRCNRKVFCRDNCTTT
eukprot:5700912-Amphidinium_carterae.1